MTETTMCWPNCVRCGADTHGSVGYVGGYGPLCAFCMAAYQAICGGRS